MLLFLNLFFYHLFSTRNVDKMWWWFC